MKRLIVAADDFGMTKSINEGILKACREGIVTAINVMPSGKAFDDAVASLKEIGRQEVGAHLALTESSPVTDRNRIPTLVRKDGTFFSNHPVFFIDLYSGKVSRDEIRVELKNQLERLVRSGLRVVNLSSHEHIHMMPSIMKIFISLAEEYKIPSIRYVHETGFAGRLSLKKIYKALLFSLVGIVSGRILDKARVPHADNFLGFLDSGRITEEALIGMLDHIPDGITELVCHPGFLSPEILEGYPFHLDCEKELFAVTSRRVKMKLKEKQIELAGYGDIARERR